MRSPHGPNCRKGDGRRPIGCTLGASLRHACVPTDSWRLRVTSLGSD
jgi:hypothetical protein